MDLILDSSKRKKRLTVKPFLLMGLLTYQAAFDRAPSNPERLMRFCVQGSHRVNIDALRLEGIARSRANGNQRHHTPTSINCVLPFLTLLCSSCADLVRDKKREHRNYFRLLEEGGSK